MNRLANTKLKLRKLVAVVVMVAVLTGCTSGATPAAGDAASFVELAQERLGSLAGVEDITVSQYPRDPDADPTALNGLDATLWGVELTVSMAETATAEEVTAAAVAGASFSTDEAVDGKWTARLLAGPERTVPEDDTSSRRAVTLEVFPVSDLPLEDVVESALRISTSPGVDSVSTFQGRTAVTSPDAASLAVAYDGVSAESLLATGGDYRTVDGRVQLTVLSEQVSPAVTRAIIAQAASYPAADVALVAPLDGPSAPSLFFNRVAEGEATAILAALTDPALASELVAPFTIPIAIRANTGDQGGFVGNVDPAAP
ncbi:hypothetical protein [Marisediminicola sp. LYQ134]|uniref:hypothetical protein n=1 Tax=Marisediminicola sp. LYQ134 TaxID=3391061 RepID=UPI0039834A22